MSETLRQQKIPDFPLPALRPEAKIILCALGIWDEPSRIRQIQSLISPDLDWEYLLRAAAHNRVSTLLYWNLAKVDSPHIPQTILNQLHLEYESTFSHNLLMGRELIRIIKQFNAAGIPALPYRGPLTAFTLYGNIGLRQIWDLDVLVHPEDVLRAKAVLLANGYMPKHQFSEAEEEQILKQDDEYHFRHQDLPVQFELHWRLVPPFMGPFSDTDFVWQHTEETILDGAKFHTLTPEMLFLVVAIHAGAKHQWTELKWICDAARAVAAYPHLNWESIFHAIPRRRDEFWIVLGLYLSQILLGAPLPEIIQIRIQRSPKFHTYFGLVWGRLFRDNFGLPGFKEWRSSVRFSENFSEVKWTRHHPLRYYFRYLCAVFTPEFSDRVTLPAVGAEKFSLIHYMIRFIRLFSEHGTALFRRIH